MKKEFDWFDHPQNIQRLKTWSYVVLGATIVAELVARYVFHAHAVDHAWDIIPGISAIFGFVACVVLIVASKFIGQYWLKRSEDYYE